MVTFQHLQYDHVSVEFLRTLLGAEGLVSERSNCDSYYVFHVDIAARQPSAYYADFFLKHFN